MSYEVLRTVKGLSILHITAANVNSIAGWRIEFDDGKEAMLYYHCGKWLQYDENWLDESTLIAVGNCIDTSLIKRRPGIKECFFYDMLVN